MLNSCNKRSTKTHYKSRRKRRSFAVYVYFLLKILTQKLNLYRVWTTEKYISKSAAKAIKLIYVWQILTKYYPKRNVQMLYKCFVFTGSRLFVVIMSPHMTPWCLLAVTSSDWQLQWRYPPGRSLRWNLPEYWTVWCYGAPVAKQTETKYYNINRNRQDPFYGK